MGRVLRPVLNVGATDTRLYGDTGPDVCSEHTRDHEQTQMDCNF